MALQKNIKEVESTEAGFVANAAAKNDGFLTDVIGYPMIKRRGNDYDYWFPEKSRDELGTYTYYDKTVKDLTALNDCIVQRRLSSYGDEDTYFDFSTDDQAVLNVGGVPFLTVAESESAAIGTLGGNLALGANTISRDGAANKGFGIDEEGVPTVYGDLVVDGNLKVGGLTASQIVETDANKKLISVAKGTAYNANFGTGSNDVCRGNDPRLSDAREPINNDYYVQGTTNRRSMAFSESNPMDASVYSTFFQLFNSDPASPDGATTFHGLRAAHPSNATYTTEIIGRIGQKKLLWGGLEGTRRDWLEIYHSGNFNPNDYQSAITGTANKVLSIQADGTGVKTGSIYDDGNEVMLDADGYIKGKLMVGSLDETPEALLTVYGENDEQSIVLFSDSVGPVLTLGIANVDHYSNVPVIRATGYSKNQLFIQHGTETPGIYYTWMEFSNNRIISHKTFEIGDSDDLSTDAKLIAWSNSASTLAIRSNPVTPTGLYMGITTVDSQPGCPVIRASEYNGAHLHIQNTDGDTYIEFETIDDVKTVTIADKLVVYNADATDTFIQVANGVTGLGHGLRVGIDAGLGDPVLRFDYGKYLHFQVESSSEPLTIATLHYSGTTKFNVHGEIHCDDFWIWKEPIAGTITPDKYIIINCNGTNYKIPVVAA